MSLYTLQQSENFNRNHIHKNKILKKYSSTLLSSKVFHGSQVTLLFANFPLAWSFKNVFFFKEENQ